MTIQAVLYLRSSKDRSDVSIDAQRRALEELAAARGIAVVGEYADAVESGKDDDRPGFQSLLRAMRDPGRAWSHVLVLDTARIARRRVLAVIFEEQECKRRGVRVIYKSLPDADPVTEMLLKSVLQAMDEWHSLTSKVKGLAGMAENVRQGWRAGGRAPRGYRLQYAETGAVRDGEMVTKSKLAPNDDALRVRAYLQARAKGLPRPRARELAGGADWPASSLIEIERNALTYAGHTVWNRHAERSGDGYVGGAKVRPANEWVVQRNTHEPLISDEEAEAILTEVKTKQRGGGRPSARCYLLKGLLVSPDGQRWQGDAGMYRLGKGKRISAEAVERAVVAEVLRQFEGPEMAGAIAQHYHRRAAQRRQEGNEGAGLQKKCGELERKIRRLTELLVDAADPKPLLRTINAMEQEHKQLTATLASVDAERATARVLAEITPAHVRVMLGHIAESLGAAQPEMLRDALAQIVQRVELSPETLDASIYYRVAPGIATGELLASPRGFEPRLPP